jgi:hypothetical protein
MNWIKENIWFLLFFIWSFPMGYYRSKFRKIVYETDDWKINIKPVLIKEMKGLFGNIFPENEEYLKMRNFYRFYLVVYVGLFLAWRFF